VIGIGIPVKPIEATVTAASAGEAVRIVARGVKDEPQGEATLYVVFVGAQPVACMMQSWQVVPIGSMRKASATILAQSPNEAIRRFAADVRLEDAGEAEGRLFSVVLAAHRIPSEREIEQAGGSFEKAMKQIIEEVGRGS